MTRVQQVAVWSVGVMACLAPAVAAQAQAMATTVVTFENKQEVPINASSISVQVQGKTEAVTQLQPLQPADTQVAVLLDDGLRSSIGRQLSDLQDFVTGLPAGVQVLVGYMQNGRVVSKGFTANHAAAAGSLRLPLGTPGISASPYFALSDFAKSWPRETESYGQAPGQAGRPHARFVLMITNGVDPYNGSVSPLNQNSPYVTQSITEAQRAGISVYSIYYGNAGVGGGLASFSGQSYLQQVGEGTGGTLLYQLRSSPVSLAPYLKNFQEAINNSQFATFAVPGAKDLVDVRFKSKVKGLKVRGTHAVRATAE